MRFIALKDCYFLAVIALMKTVRWFPSPQLKEWVVRCIAWVAYHLPSSKRRLSRENLAAAFAGRLSESQVHGIVKRAFYEFWHDAFSLLPSHRERIALKHMNLCGIEHLYTTLKNGKGVILWESGHFGRRVLSQQILHEHGFAIHQVHSWAHLGGFLSRSPTWVRQHLIKRFFETCEKQFVAEIIYLPQSNSLVFTRTLLERLRQNAIICIPSDGRSGQKFIPREFLGCPSIFSTGMVSLARISGAAILPLFCLQGSEGRTRVVIEPPIHIASDAERERGLENSIVEYVSLLEVYVRRYPEQYRSWHMLRRPASSQRQASPKRVVDE